MDVDIQTLENDYLPLTVSPTHLSICEPEKSSPGHIEQVPHYWKLSGTRRQRLMIFLTCKNHIKQRHNEKSNKIRHSRHGREAVRKMIGTVRNLLGHLNGYFNGYKHEHLWLMHILDELQAEHLCPTFITLVGDCSRLKLPPNHHAGRMREDRGRSKLSESSDTKDVRWCRNPMFMCNYAAFTTAFSSPSDGAYLDRFLILGPLI